MVKQVFRFDQETGIFIEPVVIGEYEDVPLDCTAVPLPIPNWKPVWNGQEWIETGSKEEIKKETEIKKEIWFWSKKKSTSEVK